MWKSSSRVVQGICPLEKDAIKMISRVTKTVSDSLENVYSRVSWVVLLLVQGISLPEAEHAVKMIQRSNFLSIFLSIFSPFQQPFYPVILISIYTVPTSQRVIHSTPVVTQAGQVSCLVQEVGAWGLKVSESVQQFLIQDH